MKSKNDPQVKIKIFNIINTLLIIDDRNEQYFEESMLSIQKDINGIIEYLDIKKEKDTEPIKCC